MKSKHRHRSARGVFAVVMVLLGDARAWAGEPGESFVPQTAELPNPLSLDDALAIFRDRGLDLLIADANIAGAEGELASAAGIRNPNATFSAGPTFNYNPHPVDPATGQPEVCSGCQAYALQWSMSDNGAAVDLISGKRRLRVRAARAALTSAKLARVDARRNLEAQLKSQYVQVALARAAVDFALEVQATLSKTLELNRRRYPGTIDEGGLARIEIEKLESDQSLANARLDLRQAQVGLAFLLGVRGEVPSFEVDSAILTFRIPASLAHATEESLLQLASDARPDLKAFGYERLRAKAEYDLAKRERIPDIALIMQYSQLGMGQNGGQPMSLSFGASVELPVFYQQQGEIRRARSQLRGQELQAARAAAQVVADVGGAFSAYNASREQVERMQTSMLERAKTARDTLALQYESGATTLMDFLDAQRSYIATHLQYFQVVSAFWNSVYALERASGTELSR